MVSWICGLDQDDKEYVPDFGGETVGNIKMDLREVGCEGEGWRDSPWGLW
jgi:hypothetical protein